MWIILNSGIIWWKMCIISNFRYVATIIWNYIGTLIFLSIVYGYVLSGCTLRFCQTLIQHRIIKNKKQYINESQMSITYMYNIYIYIYIYTFANNVSLHIIGYITNFKRQLVIWFCFCFGIFYNMLQFVWG